MTTSARRTADRTALVMAGMLTGMGVLHFAKPKPFDTLIPKELPGSARAWTYGSGVAELGVAGLLAVPRTRRLGGRAASLLFSGVFPGNVKMAWDWRRRPWQWQVVSLGRLPLQIPMIMASERVHHEASHG